MGHRQPDVGRPRLDWIGVVLIAVAFGIGNEIMALLIGQSADPATVASLRRFVEAREGVDKVSGCSHCSSAAR